MKSEAFDVAPDTPLLDMFVSGTPVSWQRVSTGKYGQTYVPKESRDWQKHIGKFALASTTIRNIDSPIAVFLTFYLKRPKSAAKRWRPHTKPDLDNLCKNVLDGLERAKIITNDSRIVTLSLRKYYAGLSKPCPACRHTEGSDFVCPTHGHEQSVPGVRVIIAVDAM